MLKEQILKLTSQILVLTATQNVVLSQGTFTKFGCYFDNGLCNDNEFCYDDSLLGQCLPKDNPQQYIREIPSLSDRDKELFSSELEKLTEDGFAWTDVFTQCILQSLLDSFQFGTTFDEEACAIFLEDLNTTEDLDESQEQQQQNDEDGQTEELEDNEILFDQDKSSVVPKKMIIQDSSFQETSNPDTKYLQVEGDGDDGILIEPNSEELVADYVDDPVEDEEEEVIDEEFISPSEFVNFGINDNNQVSDDIVIPYDSQEELDAATFKAIQEDLEHQYENDPEISQEEVIWPNVDYSDDYNTDMANDILTNDVRKIRKRGQPQNDPRLELEYSNENLPPYFYPTQPEYLDYAEVEEQIQPQYDEEEEADELLIDPNSNVISRLTLDGGLGSRIFNRNERLDVKKPGPFYKNSANNFFLDKLANQAENTDYLDTKENDTRRNVGQVEYEMPLLAPVKDKRELDLEQKNTQGSAQDTVHIALKNRFNTYNQGTAFIKFLAKQFKLPQNALSDQLIENQHVQFHVDPNPQNVDAVQMAKRIDQDSDLHAKIGDQIGVEIERAVPGHRDDVTTSLFSKGFTNFNLLLLVVVAASTTAALLVVAVVLMLIKRRRRILRKQGLLANGQDDTAQDEYKQLCRDWSRSSKKVDAGNKGVHKKVQNQDSKESQRSSTSSWPEEPSTTNMDISTGHMVLSYMEDHLKNKQRLEQEWVSLCGYEAEPCATTIAFKAENKKKNRYPDKLPYDHNRVILNAMVNASSSDYINASTITDHDPRNPSYIVTQAPLSSTVADFWQMIWEQGCVVIVMLTRLQDNGHQLCNRYWPEEGSEQYHIFEVHLVSEHVWCDDYLVRSVYLKNTRTGETRTVTQFHFRSWPAHGVPTSTKALLEFRRKVNKSYRGRSCPICIHCSDGVGRSGTYTLIDMVLNRMSKGCKEIDIAAALEHIRDQRGGMVQSRQQFEFCLMAVAEEVHAILKALPQ